MAREKAITLRQLSKATGISFKSVQLAFDDPTAPARTRPLEELVDFLRKRLPGTVEIPADYADRMTLLKLQTAEERKDYLKEAKEEKRLKNLEKKRLMLERDVVRAQGAAVGTILSSALSSWTKDLPTVLAGRSAGEVAKTLKEKTDTLIRQIREKLEALA